MVSVMVQRDRRVNQQEEEQRQGAVEPIPIKARPDDLALEPRQQSPRKEGDSEDQEVQGVYIISVAARMLEMHPQTLRKYERIGLVTPSRTVGLLRLYSEEDIARLNLIKYLVGERGLNLAGVQLALELFNHLIRVRNRMNSLDEKDLKKFMDESLEEMVEMLGSRLR